MKKKLVNKITLVFLLLLFINVISLFSMDIKSTNIESTDISFNQKVKSTIILDANDFSNSYKSELIDTVVLFKENVDIKLQNLIPKHWYNSLNGFSGKITESMYNYLQHAWFVSSISTNSISEFCQDDLNWGVDYIDAEQVWGGSEDARDVIPGNFAGQGIRVGVIDTGGEYTHPDLVGRFNGLDDLGDGIDDDGNGFIDDFYGWNILNGNNDPMDTQGHGTMVSGVIAAGDNGLGVIGVAPKATLVAVKVSDSTTITLANEIAGIDYCIASNVDIISMSWVEIYNPPTLADACQRAYNAGIVLVGGAGNDGINQVYWPANYNTVISVGAINDQGLRWVDPYGSGASNYGTGLDLVAPGADIYTTDLTKYNSYVQISGTSFSCPMVSGVIALMLSSNPTLTATQIRNALISTATKLDSYTFDSNGFNIEVGYGCVDAKAAVDSVKLPVQALPFIEDGSGVYEWNEIDYPYAKLQTNVNYDGKICLFNYEETTHYRNWQVAESAKINLANWDGTTDLQLSFRFRCQSNWYGSSVTQFRLLIYDSVSGASVPYTNPTSSSYYIVRQNSRNGQTWLSGKDSGWQTESFTIPAADLSQFAGTDDLVLRWGHYDSWSYDWYQREYLDYIQLEDVGVPPEPTPDAPRDLVGLGDGVSQITLTWKSPLNVLATEYKVYKKIGSSYEHIDTITHSGGINDVQLKNYGGHSPGVTYYYRVSAVNVDEIEGPYSQWSGTVGGWGFNNPSVIQQNFEYTNSWQKILLASITSLSIIGLALIISRRK